MPKHTITLHPSRPMEVVSADVVIEVDSDGKKLGELWISRGTIDWRPSGRTYASTSITWEQFDRVMQAASVSVPRVSRKVVNHTGKYRSLWLHLTSPTGAQIQMSFARVEQVLGFLCLRPPESTRHIGPDTTEAPSSGRSTTQAGSRRTSISTLRR